MGRFAYVIIALVATLAVHACFVADVCSADTEDEARAWALFAAGDNEGSLAIYESLIASQPHSERVPLWQYRVSWCCWLLGRYTECFIARQRAIDLTDDAGKRRDWQNESVKWYFTVGSYDAAISTLNTLVAENPGDADTADWHALMSLCNSLSGKGKESIKDLDKAIELAGSPESKRDLRERRAIEYSLNGDHSKAKAEYEGLVKDYPGAPRVAYWYREISSICWRQKRYQDSLRALLKAIASVTDADAKRSWEIGCGVRAYQVNEYGIAASALQEPARDSSNVDLNRLLARSYIHLCAWEEALSAYQALEKRLPEHNLEWQLWIGYCYEQRGEYQQAESIFRSLISKYPNDDSIRCARFRLAKCLSNEGRNKEAQAELDAYYHGGKHKSEQPMSRQSKTSMSSNQNVTSDQAYEDLDTFPDVDDETLAKLVSMAELTRD